MYKKPLIICGLSLLLTLIVVVVVSMGGCGEGCAECAGQKCTKCIVQDHFFSPAGGNCMDKCG